MTRARRLAVTLTVTFTVISAALALSYPVWQHWVARETGSENTPGMPPNYNYWSGFGSVFPWGMGCVATLAIVAYHNWKARNCHHHRCWRIGSLPVGQYTVCRKHHYESTGDVITTEHLAFHHKLHTRKRLIDAGFKPGGHSEPKE